MVTFFNVGQALFCYEEYHGNCIVYDCGGENKTLVHNKIDQLKDFKEYYSPDDLSKTIDILFISHYDRDHINGIEYLLNHFKIKHVILPLIDLKGRLYSYFTTAYNANIKNNNFAKTFYENPTVVFNDNETNIHFVAPYNPDNNGVDNKNIENPDRNYDESDIFAESGISVTNLNKTFNSGTVIQLNDYWILKPYNLYYMNDGELSLFWNNLGLYNITDIDQILDEWNKMKNKVSIKKALIEACKFVDNTTINDYSLTLYSGNKNTSTLYLGDYNAKDHYDELRNAYKIYWNKIECIQVPHHGSKHNFNKNFLTNLTEAYFVISGHSYKTNKSNSVDPSQVIEIFENSSNRKHLDVTGLGDVYYPCCDINLHHHRRHHCRHFRLCPWC